MHIKKLTFITIDSILVLIGVLGAALMFASFVVLAVEPFNVNSSFDFNDVIKLAIGAFTLVISERLSRQLRSWHAKSIAKD